MVALWLEIIGCKGIAWFTIAMKSIQKFRAEYSCVKDYTPDYTMMAAVIGPINGISRPGHVLRSRKPYKSLGLPPSGVCEQGFLDLRGWVRRQIQGERDQSLIKQIPHSYSKHTRTWRNVYELTISNVSLWCFFTVTSVCVQTHGPCICIDALLLHVAC